MLVGKRLNPRVITAQRYTTTTHNVTVANATSFYFSSRWIPSGVYTPIDPKFVDRLKLYK